MATARRLASNPVVRGRVRSGVRSKHRADRIVADVQDTWPHLGEAVIRKRIKEEQDRQRDVDKLMGADKRKSMDVAGLLGCPPGTGKVRMSMTIFWTDPNTGETRKFGTTAEVKGSGRLSDILNEGLEHVARTAREMGYDPGKVTSANTQGKVSYRIEYVECV